MPNIFFISDTHFGHTACWRDFKLPDGKTPMRCFTSTEEMDETMVANWNRVVGPKDKVYHLGDFAIARKNVAFAGRLNGDKVLIRGNHDIFKLEEYTRYFREIRGSHKLENFVMTHIPIHPDSLARWCDGNIHGHLHNNEVKGGKGLVGWVRKKLNMHDPRYICVSVEHINYTPIAFEDLKVKMKNR